MRRVVNAGDLFGIRGGGGESVGVSGALGVPPQEGDERLHPGGRRRHPQRAMLVPRLVDDGTSMMLIRPVDAGKPHPVLLFCGLVSCRLQRRVRRGDWRGMAGTSGGWRVV